MDMKIAKRQFSNQRSKAKGRRDALGNTIKFLLTFEEWVAIWNTSGKYEQRGCNRGQYVMSRHNDIGHYEIGNVAITSGDQNISAAHKGVSKSAETRKKMSAAQKGREVSDETRAKISATQMGVPHPKVMCPHCQLEGGDRAMNRWHFDNCKQRRNR